MKKRKAHHQAELRCLNCDQVLHGAYCANCGQKANLHKDNFWHLLTHFVSDYFHYDGRFLHTVRALFARPGKITCEYTAGKRLSYLNPIQLYIFSSALFFFIFTKWVFVTGDTPDSMKSIYERYPDIRAKQDSVFQHTPYRSGGFSLEVDELGFTVNDKVFTLYQYDSIEATLPADQQERGLKRMFNRKLLKVNDEAVAIDRINSERYAHAVLSSLPKALFVLLPVFALWLKLFFRRRPYADHIIFSLHFHSILFTLLSGVCLIFGYFELSGFYYFSFPLWIFIVVYLFLSLRYYTGLRWAALSVRFFALLFAYGATLLLTAGLIFIISIFLL